jgi:hypothetical protein
VRRASAQDPAYAGQEPEVGHVVGLVEDGDLDVVERAVALTDQVLEPAGTGHDDVDTAAQGVDLRLLADAAEDGASGESGRASQWRQRGSIWPTSSRVGARIRARGAPRRGRRPSVSRATSGSRNA